MDVVKTTCDACTPKVLLRLGKTGGGFPVEEVCWPALGCATC